MQENACSLPSAKPKPGAGLPSGRKRKKPGIAAGDPAAPMTKARPTGFPAGRVLFCCGQVPRLLFTSGSGG